MSPLLLRKLLEMAPSLFGAPQFIDPKAVNPIDYGYGVEGAFGGGEQAYLGTADAARHLGWQGEMQRRFGKLPAAAAGAFHEIVGGSDHPLESKMDWHNNAVARKRLEGIKSQKDMDAALKKLMAEAVEVNTMEEYEQASSKDVPIYVGNIGRQNPSMFNLKWQDPTGDTTR